MTKCCDHCIRLLRRAKRLVRGVLIKIKGVPCRAWRWMKLLLGCRDVMQQQTITSRVWPEWMIDDSFRLPPLTITQMGGRRLAVAPHRGPWQWCPKPRPANVTADLSGRSVYILYLHPAIDTTENKVFSHSESSPNDFVVVQVRARPSKLLRELCLSLYELESGGVWKDGLRLFLKWPQWWTTWCGRTVSGALWSWEAVMSFFLSE